MKEIRIEIPQYIRKVRLSNKRRPKYYKWNGEDFFAGNKRLPDKYRKTPYMIYSFDKKGNYFSQTYFGSDVELYKNFQHFICNALGEKVLANPKTANEPNDILIRGQDIYSGNLREFTRGKVFQTIKQSFLPYIEQMPIIDFYPVRITLEIHDTVKNCYDNSIDDYGVRWDIGNRAYPYGKAFLDLLSTGRTGKRDAEDNPIRYFKPKLIDDSRMYVTEDPQGGVFVPLLDNDDTNRKLVFIIREDDRPEIINNHFYKTFHNERKKENNTLGEVPF